MLTERFSLKAEGSLPSAALYTYILDNSSELNIQKRPLILMCPGGGYELTSDREAEPIAMHFLSIGYHVAILRYSVAPAVYPTALLEAAQAMKLIHEHADIWHVDTEKIVIQGCSAGGHLAASLGMFWHEPWLSEQTDTTADTLEPAGMLLCYPVITSGKYTHEGSVNALLGRQKTQEMLTRISLEKQVSEYTPKAFIWHTYTDDCVPVENSLLLISAMRAYNIPVEFHMYPLGGHGLSTCDRLAEDPENYGVQKECQSWLTLAKAWLENI